MYQTNDRATASKVILQQMKRAEEYRNMREKEDMKFLTRMTGVKSGRLLQYYSKYVGSEGLRAQLERFWISLHCSALVNVSIHSEKPQYDAFKNPTGTSFLLGREKAFRGFRVLVFFTACCYFADFFRRWEVSTAANLA